MTLLVSPNQAPSSLGETLADAMIAGSDVGGSVPGSAWEDVLSAQGFDRRAVFASDRYGQIAGRRIIQRDDFPTINELKGRAFCELLCRRFYRS